MRTSAVSNVQVPAICFDPIVDEYDGSPCAECYECHPSTFVVATNECTSLSENANVFTVESPNVMARRMQNAWAQERNDVIYSYRQAKLDHIMRHSAAWESSERMPRYAVRTPSARHGWEQTSRQGANRMKKLEQEVKGAERLAPENATLIRALSVRANYMAQDRPDCSFVTKDLCREFAAPTTRSYLRLVRLMAYLIGAPCPVFRYEWQPIPDSLTIYVDADVAGCAATRRSTSGGICMLGGHCIKH